jgi:hypothetical protein
MHIKPQSTKCIYNIPFGRIEKLELEMEFKIVECVKKAFTTKECPGK